MNKTLGSMMILFGLAVVSPAFAQAPSLAELEQRCEAAREEKLAPLREAAIEQCVSSRRSGRTREDCERLYADFGEGAGTVEGGRRPRMFNDLPECVEYFEALNRQRRGGSRH